MAFLGQEIESKSQKTLGTPRCLKDLIEEELFERRRDLFTEVDLVFFDTTSLYFEGRGGESIGKRGHSKDHRPDLCQSGSSPRRTRSRLKHPISYMPDFCHGRM
jgi:hypothetical protein